MTETCHSQSNTPQTRRVWFKNATQVLVVSVAVLVIIEVFMRVFLHLAQPVWTLDKYYDHKMVMIKEMEQPDTPLILSFGDSTMDNAFYAEYFEHLLREQGIPSTVYNLSSPRVNLDVSLTLLQRLQQKGLQPHAVLVNTSVRNFKPRKQKFTVFKNTYIGECRINPPTAFGEKLTCLIKDHFYIVRFREFLKSIYLRLPEMISHPEEARDPDLIEPAPLPSPKGWQSLYKFNSHAQLMENETGYHRKPEPELTADPNTPYGRFSKYCKEQGIPLILVQLPEYKSHDYTETYKKASAINGDCFINLITAMEEPPYYHDHYHLNAVGSVAFTEKLSMAVKNCPSFIEQRKVKSR